MRYLMMFGLALLIGGYGNRANADYGSSGGYALSYGSSGGYVSPGSVGGSHGFASRIRTRMAARAARRQAYYGSSGGGVSGYGSSGGVVSGYGSSGGVVSGYGSSGGTVRGYRANAYGSWGGSSGASSGGLYRRW